MFETVIAGHPAPRRRALAGPLSLALHASVIAAIVTASAWRITDPGEPNVPIVLVSPSAPPPPAGPRESPAVRPAPARPSTGTLRPIPLPTPTPIPVRIGPLSDEPPTAVLSGNTDTGAGSGSPWGVDGGTGQSLAPGGGDAAPPISATAPDVLSPRLLRQIAPDYPERARRIREQGVVLLQAVIGTSGDVEDVRVVSSSSRLFEEAAVRALQQWRYSPATLAGRAVRVYLTVTIRFTLH